MRVAIVQGFEFHYEMILYAIEFCATNNIEFDLYVNKTDEHKWLATDFFKIINIFKKISFSHEEYDRVLLLTDDDWTIPDVDCEWARTKLVCIDHFFKVRRHFVRARICTRPFNLERPQAEWALPVFNGISTQDKLTLLSKQNQVRVACVGNTCMPPPSVMKKYFPDFLNTEFNMIARCILQQHLYKEYSNIKIHVNASADLLIRILKESDYVMFFPLRDVYLNQMMSGAFPLAISYLCRLIVPREIVNQYNGALASALTYDIAHEARDLCETNVEAVANDREFLIARRNRVFKAALE
jgi:hypothetical protein